MDQAFLLIRKNLRQHDNGGGKTFETFTHFRPMVHVYRNNIRMYIRISFLISLNEEKLDFLRQPLLSQHLCKSQQWKQQINVPDLFRISNARITSLRSFNGLYFLALHIFLTCSKLTIKTADWHYSDAVIINFEQISCIFLVFLIIYFEQVIGSWLSFFRYQSWLSSHFEGNIMTEMELIGIRIGIGCGSLTFLMLLSHFIVGNYPSPYLWGMKLQELAKKVG